MPLLTLSSSFLDTDLIKCIAFVYLSRCSFHDFALVYLLEDQHIKRVILRFIGPVEDPTIHC